MIVVGEYWVMPTSRQEALRSEGVTCHIWERYSLSAHAVLFFTRAWEIGRMTGYVKNYSSPEEKIIFQEQLVTYEHLGWMREIPMPFEAQDDSPESLERQVAENQKFLKDKGALRMCNLFAEEIEGLHAGVIEKYVRNTPALWEEFAMRTPAEDLCLLDPDPFAPPPTEPNSLSICVDIRNNIQVSPRLCFRAIDQKLESITGSNLFPILLQSLLTRSCLIISVVVLKLMTASANIW